MDENKTLEMALQYANAGLRVLPLKAGQKTPATPNGFYDATTDTKIIKRWFADKPNANIGIATGSVVGTDKCLVVIDLDVGHADGVDGTLSLAEWETQNGQLPPTMTARTGRGGIHRYYFVNANNKKSRVGILRGVDVRGSGGYIVAPPSVNAETAQEYDWREEFAIEKIADGGEILEKLLSVKTKNKQSKSKTFNEGERNDTLYRLACSLQAKGKSDEEIREKIHKANREKCLPPLDDTEVDRVVDSALTQPKGEPDIDNNKKPPLSLELFKTYCASLNPPTQFAFNEVTRNVEIYGRGNADWVENDIIDRLEDELRPLYSGVTSQRVAACISMTAYDNALNPILNKIKANPWDGEDRLRILYEMLGIADDDLSCTFLRKWLMQGYCGLYNKKSAPFALDLVLVLQGRQGLGKTRLLEKLALGFFAEGESLNPTNKDSVMIAASCFIYELGELGSTMKRDKDTIKAFISRPVDTIRVPFGRTLSKFTRHAILAGTVNEKEYLVDDTGSRRWLTISIADNIQIDMDDLQKFDAVQLWAQIRYLVDLEISKGKTYANCWRLTAEEAARRDERNFEFSKPLFGEQEVRDVLAAYDAAFPKNSIVDSWRTATEFINANAELRGLSAIAVSKVFRKIGIETRVDPHTRTTKWLLPWRTTY